MNKQNAHQGGWIANFLIIGAVLVLGLIGSVYFLKTRSANPEVVVEDSEMSQTDGQDIATSDDNKKPEAENTKPDTTKEKKVVEPAPAETKDSTDSEASSQETTRDLPATGPAETSQAIIGASLLAFSASAYVQSRRTQ